MLDTTDVRSALEAVDREMALAEGGGRVSAPLRASFTRLVAVLALGPAPELARCPHCGSTGMRAATRCGTCWARLVPPEPASG